MDDRLMARHGRFGQEIDELERLRAPELAAREDEMEKSAAPARSIGALSLTAIFWCYLGIDGAVRGTVAVLLGPEHLFLPLFLALVLTLPPAYVIARAGDRSAQTLTDKAKRGRSPIVKALKWWIQGSLSFLHVLLAYFLFLHFFSASDGALYRSAFPGGSAAFEQLFVNLCHGLAFTTLLLFFAAVRAQLESRRVEV